MKLSEEEAEVYTERVRRCWNEAVTELEFWSEHHLIIPELQTISDYIFTQQQAKEAAAIVALQLTQMMTDEEEAKALSGETIEAIDHARQDLIRLAFLSGYFFGKENDLVKLTGPCEHNPGAHN